MKHNRTVRSNIERMCISNYFIIALVMTVFLMLSGYIYTDFTNDKSYSILSLIAMKGSKSIIEQGGLNWRDIYLLDSPGYTWMFAPVIVTLPYIAMICPGNSNSNTRFELFRTSKKKYIFGKIISGIIVSGMIMAMAQIVYGIVCLLIIGNKFTGDNNLMNVYKLSGFAGYVYKNLGNVSVYILRIMEAFLYGMISSLPVMFLSAIIKNKYLVFSIPFMLNYFYTMFLNNGVRKLFKINIVIKIRQIFLQSNIQSIFLYNYKIMFIIILIFIIQILAVYAIHYFIMERRCDCCER